MFLTAVQLYSIREEMEKDFKGTLLAVKEMGYDGVEFAGLFGLSAVEVSEMLKEIGLTAISAHVPYDEMISDPDGVLTTYAQIGCKYVALPYLSDECRIGAEKGEETLVGMRMLGEKAKELGMTLLYHNHDFEFEKLDGEFKLDLLYKAIPADILQTEIDTCWVSVAGVNPAEYVKKYTGRAPIVHLKDYYMTGSAEGAYEFIGVEAENKKPDRKTFEFRTLGSGKQDIPAILAAAKSAGSAWVVVEQDNPTPSMTAMECIKASIDYLKQL